MKCADYPVNGMVNSVPHKNDFETAGNQDKAIVKKAGRVGKPYVNSIVVNWGSVFVRSSILQYLDLKKLTMSVFKRIQPPDS